MKTDEKALRAASAHGYIVCDDLPLATRSFIKGYKVACQEAAGEGKVTVDREALTVKEFPHHDVPRALRRIADNIEAGTWPGETCTLILDGHNIFSFGKGRIHGDQRGVEAVFDLNVALHRMVREACKEFDEN